jgi:hypothetical protein
LAEVVVPIGRGKHTGPIATAVLGQQQQLTIWFEHCCDNRSSVLLALTWYLRADAADRNTGILPVWAGKPNKQTNRSPTHTHTRTRITQHHQTHSSFAAVMWRTLRLMGVMAVCLLCLLLPARPVRGTNET